MMTAASVCFSFHGLAEKLGTTTLSIHAPVPGFEEQLEKLLNRTFTALQVRQQGVLWVFGNNGSRLALGHSFTLLEISRSSRQQK